MVLYLNTMKNQPQNPKKARFSDEAVEISSEPGLAGLSRRRLSGPAARHCESGGRLLPRGVDRFNRGGAESAARLPRRRDQPGAAAGWLRRTVRPCAGTRSRNPARAGPPRFRRQDARLPDQAARLRDPAARSGPPRPGGFAAALLFPLRQDRGVDRTGRAPHQR